MCTFYELPSIFCAICPSYRLTKQQPSTHLLNSLKELLLVGIARPHGLIELLQTKSRIYHCFANHIEAVRGLQSMTSKQATSYISLIDN